MIDTTFNVYSDANGGDPDATSPTLRQYHKLLWSKLLPNGKRFDLHTDRSKAYLYHESELGTFALSSDAITHSYKNRRGVTQEIPTEVQELFDQGSTIGAYIVFPAKQVNRKPNINQARGMSFWIDDRFDLTLECIRRFYSSESSPLSEVLERYASFFHLFESFEKYVEFFLLNDLVDQQGQVKFFTAFNGFQASPKITSVSEYLAYKANVMAFIQARNERINRIQQED